MKSEPDVYSIDDLARDGRTSWDGVRNHEARNLMRAMRKGDLAFFYHSNADPSALVGVMRVAGPARPDETAFDPKDDHYDPRSRRDDPTWWAVDVEFVEKLPRPVSLHEVKAEPRLAQMALLKRSRLSVTPVSAAEWKLLLKMAGK
jgi:predicted RNA-binding protein with PUA-like domain